MLCELIGLYKTFHVIENPKDITFKIHSRLGNCYAGPVIFTNEILSHEILLSYFFPSLEMIIK